VEVVLVLVEDVVLVLVLVVVELLVVVPAPAVPLLLVVPAPAPVVCEVVLVVSPPVPVELLLLPQALSTTATAATEAIPKPSEVRMATHVRPPSPRCHVKVAGPPPMQGLPPPTLPWVATPAAVADWSGTARRSDAWRGGPGAGTVPPR
jgi:hypothetical protein